MRATKFLFTIAFASCAQAIACAQTTAKLLEFEVASVKQVAPPQQGAQTAGGTRATGRGVMHEAPDRITYQGVTLKAMLLKAYDLKQYQLSGPAWLDDQHYDVNATIPEGATKEQIPEMLQHLLLERFRITLHTEMKDEPVYVLAVAKGGPKLKSATDGERESIGFTPHRDTGLEELTYRAQTMARFAGYLSIDLGRSVMDQTGLTDKYDFDIQAEPQAVGFSPLPSSLFTGVRELGLKLESGKAPIKHLIIDKAQKIPTEN